MQDMNQHYIEKIELLLRTACFTIRQKGRAILQDYDITPPQFNALQFLVDEGDMTIGELGSKLYLAPSTITDLIDRMENSCLVRRVRDTKDRRTVKIKVEDKGFNLINQVILRRSMYIDSLLDGMSEQDKIRFIKYLEILNNISEE